MEMNQTNILRIEDAVKQVLETATDCEMQNIPTGFQGLDIITKGWFPGEFCIIGGRPMMGKTGFILGAIGNMIRGNVPVALLSATDMMNTNFLSRIVSSIKRQDVGYSMNEKIYTLKNTDFSGLPLYIDLQPILTLDYIKENARKLVAEQRVRCIFIEKIQSIFDSEPNGNTKEGMENICHELKLLARELNVPLIVTSDLNRGAEHRDGLDGKRPQICDLRSSSAIENEADSIYLIFNPCYYHIYYDESGNKFLDTVEVIITKKKYGNMGVVKLNLDPTTGLIKDFSI